MKKSYFLNSHQDNSILLVMSDYSFNEINDEYKFPVQSNHNLLFVKQII